MPHRRRPVCAGQQPGGVCNNTAVGREALYWNTGGTYNTAIGDFALNSNTTGGTNTASGARALERNTTGHDNTATGASALRFNTAGGANTASGAYALYNNNTGGGNTASGFHALEWNTGGSQNTATGFSALLSNTTGIQNVASGASALRSNQSGFSNSAHGSFALYFNETGARNTASGQGALSSTRSNNNTGIGYNSGAASVFGTYNIYLGADVLGTTDDANTMRLGLPYDGVSGAGQNRTFIAGIHGTQLTGSYLQVVVDANGQLGTLTPPAQLSGGATATPLSMLQQQVQEQQVTIAAQQATIEDLLVRLARLEAASRGARRP